MKQREILDRVALRMTERPVDVQHVFATPSVDGFTCLGRVFPDVEACRRWFRGSGYRVVCGRLVSARTNKRGRPSVAPDCPVCGGVMLVQHTAEDKRYCKCPLCGENTTFEQPTMENQND